MIDEMKKKEWTEDWIARYRAFLTSYTNVGLSSKVDKERFPKLELSSDCQSYTDNTLIHIGLGVADLREYNPDLPSDELQSLFEQILMTYAYFLIGHESQHVLSTTDKAWQWGIDHGMKTVLETYSSMTEKRPRRFYKDSDYDRYLSELEADGFHVSPHALQKFSHFIANSLEDGRIERLRMAKKPGFTKYVRFVRGEEWITAPVWDPNSPDPVDKQIGQLADAIEHDPRTNLCVLLNQLLSLATTGHYQNGFLDLCEKSPKIHKKIQSLIPHIRRAVASPNCRGCMEESIELCRMLTTEIMEASKMSPLEEILSEFIRKVLKDSNFTADSQSEETGGDGGKDFDIFVDGSDGTSNDPESDKDPGEKIKESMEKAFDQTETETGLASRAGDVDKSKANVPDITGTDSASPKEDDVSDSYSYDVEFKETKRDYPCDETMPPDLLAVANVLKRKISRIFRNMEAPVLKGQQKGRIYPAGLYKLAMDRTDIFVRRSEVPEFDGCAYFLMDHSGSMADGEGSKRWYCCRALATLEHAFSDYMPVKITAFHARGNDIVEHFVIKNWKEKVTKNGSYQFLVHKGSGYGNKDGYSIRIATSELLKQPEKKKLLVILSDGVPSNYNSYSEALRDTHDAVKEARRNGIEVFSIYFGFNLSNKEEIDTFLDIYEKNCIITEPERIQEELVRKMKKFMFK